MLYSLLLTALIACDGGEQPTPPAAPAPAPAPEPAPAPAPAPEPEPEPAAAAAPAEPGVYGSAAVKDSGQEVGTELTIGSDGNNMAFDTKTLEASAGLVRIRLKNNATAAAMVHNIVIVEQGKEDAVGSSAMRSSQDKQWLPADGFLAASALAQPGEEVTVVADLKPGTYAFICTFPGHYLVMRGTLTVT